MSKVKIFNIKKFLVIILLLLPINVFAMTPDDKECLQRGYGTYYEYCVFPDGSRCLGIAPK